MKIYSRKLNNNDYISMRELLLREGPNAWNYITEESISDQFTLIKEGKALAAIIEGSEIFGFAILIFRTACPLLIEKYDDLKEVAYIADVVVSKDKSGQGIGSNLLLKCISLAKKENISKVYIERHEENLASAGMMEKAGFEIIDTFHDPQRRTVGSENTAVLMVQ